MKIAAHTPPRPNAMNCRRSCLAVLGLITLHCHATSEINGASLTPPLPKVRVASDGRSFVSQRGRPFHPWGVNYFRPGTGWAPQIWKQFDETATREDFRRMTNLGVNCVRVFLTFGSFYQKPGELESNGLQKFDRFLALAEEAGLYVHPTGPDHWEGLPDWARRDRYADEDFLQALEQFWRLFAARYRGRTALFAYDLLNEPEVPWDTPALRAKWNQWLKERYPRAEARARAWGQTNQPVEAGLLPPPDPKASQRGREFLDYQLFREQVADDWTRRQVAAIKAGDPDALVTVGLIQWSVPCLLPGLQHYSAFRPSRQAPLLDFMEVHFYPLAKGFYEYTSPEAEMENLAYLESVLREVAAPGKPVVVAEFGWYGGGKPTINQGRHPYATEEQQAQWCRRLVETTRGLAVGWLNWGFYDHPGARDVTEFIGLLKPDGAIKAWGRTFAEMGQVLRQQPVPPSNPVTRPTLDWEACLVDPAAAARFRQAYLEAFQQTRMP